MKEVYVKFPLGLEVDAFNPPEDFEKQIQAKFAYYTQGTAKDFTYQDKLSFCDHIIEKLHKAGDE